MKTEKAKLIERIILVDTGYVDDVSGILHHNYQQTLNRGIAPADLAKWLVNCGLDAGWRTEKAEGVQVVFVRFAGNPGWTNFQPDVAYKELDGMAFRDDMLGEFILSVVDEEDAESQDPLFVQCVRALEEDKAKHDVVLVPNMPRYGAELAEVLEHAKNSRYTLLSMQDPGGKGFTHVQLGFGLLDAMGISPEELG